MTDEVPKLCNFNDVFNAEFDELRARREIPDVDPNAEKTDSADKEAGSAAKDSAPAAKADRISTTAYGLTGLALSGGGVRSAAFSLGVLQGLHTRKFIDRVDYLSTVSGGGYIGTAMSVGMSTPLDPATTRGEFPFGKTGNEPGETPETQHLRDHSRYLLQEGLPSAISAFAIYMRGIVMNCMVLLPFLLIGSAILIALNPDTARLVSNDFGLAYLHKFPGDTPMPLTIVGALVLLVLWIIYAISVSINPIAPLQTRRRLARMATAVLLLFGVVLVLELHTWLLRAVFEYTKHIKVPEPKTDQVQHVQVFESLFAFVKNFVIWIGPLIVVVLPFIKSLATKATADATGGWADLGKRFASRVLLIFAAAVVPLALWLVMMQLAYWGTAVSTCPDTQVLQQCQGAIVDNWSHAPDFLRKVLGVENPIQKSEVGWLRVPPYYIVGAVVLFVSWLFLSVNSNSLHQLYRDRLGSAFLVKRSNRKAGDPSNPVASNGHAPYQLEAADTFKLTELNSGAPYHLINAALNVPGSKFANRRGRNADFFIFSRRYVGSEATGYVRSELAEKTTDGLNIGTAMAISGAAAAPNMGMASMRPLSPTIAFLNVRLGRWLRHPADVASWAQSNKEGKKASWWFGTPGPKYLLREAFSKSGRQIGEASPNGQKKHGFVFLTDGGHIENLGVYELLRRRCSLIIAVDGEADPDLDGGSLVQLERFARIDLGIRIAMDWKAIAARSRAVSDEVKKKIVNMAAGPHVALGMIDYPPAQDGGAREKGVLVYIKASLSGDENDYVMAYKAGHAEFPHETTLDQFFSEEQFEVYRALGEHIARRFLDGRDAAVAAPSDRTELLAMVRKAIPGVTPV